MSQIDELVKNVLSELQKIVKTETVVGEPIEVQDVVLVPVSRVSFGFGAAGGASPKKESNGEGTGGGLLIEPIAFIVIRPDSVDLMTLKQEGGVGRVMDLIPQVVDKVKGMKDKKTRDGEK